MLFKKLTIKNFRNFKDITVDLADRNVFFGTNDIGKTNLLYALRFVFDYNIRKNGFSKSDFHHFNTEEDIEIGVELDLSESESEEVEIISSIAKGAVYSGTGDTLYIMLKSNYNQKHAYYDCEMKWGNNIEYLENISRRGNIYEIDNIFNVIYVDSSLNLGKLFSRNFNTMLNKKDDDLEIINKQYEEVNKKIGALSSIIESEKIIKNEFKKYHQEGFNIKLASNNFSLDPYKNVAPHIIKDDDENLYPLSGDGQRKLAAYSLMKLVGIKKKRINLFLIEEPENHLHRTTLIRLSSVIFNEDEFPFLFLTTHSSELLTDMEDVQLVRIFKDTELKAQSTFYKISKRFNDVRKLLNKGLSEALFYDKVLLIEGPSEYTLFTKVMKEVDVNHNAGKYYILPVNGIAFSLYIEILHQVGIKVMIKTDNDIRKCDKIDKYQSLGLNRIKRMAEFFARMNLEDISLPAWQESVLFEDVEYSTDRSDYKVKLYEKNKDKLDLIREKYNIYLSYIDLENDLEKVIPTELSSYLGDNPVIYLQNKKLYNMVELVRKLKTIDCQKIYDHYNFKCLEAIK